MLDTTNEMNASIYHTSGTVQPMRAMTLAELVAVGLSVVALRGSRRVTSAIIWLEPSSCRRLEH